MEDLPVEFWEFDYTTELLKSLKGKIKYYKSKDLEVWFDENGNVTQELRFWYKKLLYRFTARYEKGQLISSSLYFYCEDGTICTEQLFLKTVLGEETNYISYDNYPEVGDYNVFEKCETINILEEYNGVKYDKCIYKHNGDIYSVETDYFDLSGNRLSCET